MTADVRLNEEQDSLYAVYTEEDIDEARKQGAIDELNYLISCVHDDCVECKKTKKFFKNRIRELEEGVE